MTNIFLHHRYINGAPGITVAPTAATVRAFAFGVRQIFYKVTITSNPPSTDYGNGTTHTVLEIVSSLLVQCYDRW